MNIELMKNAADQLGCDELKEMVEVVEMGGCPLCQTIVTTDEFSKWDALTQKEFGISRMCKNCQDKMFGED
jgi:hypothetical protein